MNDRKVRIKGFLARFHRNLELGDDEDIFALGFVNSLMAIQLVTFLQKEFGVAIEDEDLDFDNFRTVSQMDALVERKCAHPVVA